jgi:hypothetical protein
VAISIENLVESLALRLWGLVAVKVEARMVVELAVVRAELLAEAQQHRELGTELGKAIADGFEAASERITREWMVMEKTLCSQPVTGGKDRHHVANDSILLGRKPSDGKRSRGRPRKSAPSGLGVSEQETSAISAGTPNKELVP